MVGMLTVTSFCFAGLCLVIESWLNERVSNENCSMINLSVTIVG